MEAAAIARGAGGAAGDLVQWLSFRDAWVLFGGGSCTR